MIRDGRRHPGPRCATHAHTLAAGMQRSTAASPDGSVQLATVPSAAVIEEAGGGSAGRRRSVRMRASVLVLVDRLAERDDGGRRGNHARDWTHSPQSPSDQHSEAKPKSGDSGSLSARAGGRFSDRLRCGGRGQVHAGSAGPGGFFFEGV